MAEASYCFAPRASDIEMTSEVIDAGQAAVNYVHGGNLTEAVAAYGFAREQWLDISTGVAPWGWPVPTLPAEVWRRLPSNPTSTAESPCPLLSAAAAYYGCEYDADDSALLELAGSQQAIQALPGLFPQARVALPSLGYWEHRRAWQGSRHQLWDYDERLELLEEKIFSGQLDIVVVINPNNPTGQRLDRQRLLRWREYLAGRGGWLIVDEAFMDVEPADSLAGQCPRPGLVVLRSLGKFFGLAGLRLGFMLAPSALCRRLAEQLGSWQVSGPAQWVGARALADELWQQQQRQRITSMAALQIETLQALLDNSLLNRDGPSQAHLIDAGLFMSVFLPPEIAEKLHRSLARQAVWGRRFVDPQRQRGCLRFGLAADASELQRMTAALRQGLKEL